MKKFIYFIGILGLISVMSITACDKTENTEMINGKKGGKGNGGGNTGTSSTTSSTSSYDSLLNACGMTISDTGCWYPVVQLNNIQWRHQTGYSYNPNTGLYDYPYDILVITFDPPTIAGKTITHYMLLANNCETRVVCNKSNGIYTSQVTTGNPTTTFWLPIGTSWLNPNIQEYTGLIQIITSDGCMSISQPFTFEPPRIL
jgi:hypothetical protein